MEYGSTPYVGMALASFPGSCMGRVKSLVHSVCACSVTPGFLGLWKLADTTPQYHSVYHRIIVHCTRTIEDGGAFKRVWERGQAGADGFSPCICLESDR